MEAAKYIFTWSAVAAKNQLTINDLDDDSLGMIFEKLPYIDKMRIGSVCQRWYAVSEANWSIYSKRLTIGKVLGDFPSYDNIVKKKKGVFPSYDNFAKKKNILKKLLQRSGPYLQEITFTRDVIFCEGFKSGTIKCIAELCPNLKRVNSGSLRLNKNDWLACSNLEAFSFSHKVEKGNELALLFGRNKRLHRLEIFSNRFLTANDFDHLDPGQLKFLHIEYCSMFEFTAEVTDKLAESLVNLTYSLYWGSTPPNLQHLRKLKNLRSLDLKVGIKCLDSEFIAHIAENCWKLECLFLAISSSHAYDENVFETLFDLPYLRRLVIIVEENKMLRKESVRLLERAAHLESFVIETCDKCGYGRSSLEFCCRHRRG